MLKSVGVIYIIRCLFIILSLNYASISMADSCHQNYKQAVKQQQLKKYTAAISHYASVTEACKLYAKAQYQLGQLYYNQQQIKKAQAAYQQAIKKAVASTETHALALDGLAYSYRKQGHYQKAKDLYTQSLAIWKKLQGDTHPEVASSLTYVAQMEERLSNYEQAEGLFKQALAIREQAFGKEHQYVAYSLNNLAQLYIKLDNTMAAAELLHRALTIKEKTLKKDDVGLATSLNNLALLYNNISEYSKAEPLYLRALAIREQQLGKNHPDTATVLNNLALLYHNLSDYERAEPLYLRALKIREQELGADHPRLASTLNTLALLYSYQENYDEAEALFQRALNIWERSLGSEHEYIATTLNNLASVYRKTGRTAQAKALHEHALAIREKKLGGAHSDVANSLNNLAVLYHRSKEYDQAESLYQRALYIATESQQQDLLWLVQSNLGDVFAAQGYYSLAVFFGKQAVNSLQNLRLTISKMDKGLRKKFIGTKSHVYESLADLLMEQGRLVEAQEVITMLKEEEYFDFLGRDEEADQRETHISLTTKEQQWQHTYEELLTRYQGVNNNLKQAKQSGHLQRIETVQQEVHQALTALQQFFQKIKQHSQQVKAQEVVNLGAENFTILRKQQQMLAGMSENVAIVHYLMTNKKLRILVTTKETQISRESSISKIELNRKILAFHQALQEPSQRPLKQAHQLYQLVFAPIADDLEKEGITTLMLSLSGTLHYVPIAALFDGKQYLIERYAMMTYTHAAEQNLSLNHEKTWRIAGLGLSQQVNGFNALPSVEKELSTIVKENKADEQGIIEGVSYLNEAFTAQKVKTVLSQNYPIVHIASHFVFNPGTEKNSYLLLGTGEQLSLADIRAQYRFANVDLLTLSACETALGELANGKEIEGFGTLAQNQGARGVLATLWAVNDTSTGLFMQHFYTHYATAQLKKAKALQATQQAFIQAGKRIANKKPSNAAVAKIPYFYSHPYYWAAFILMGNEG